MNKKINVSMKFIDDGDFKYSDTKIYIEENLK